MLTFFEISTLEMWPDIMFNANDYQGIDLSLIPFNSPASALVFITYIFFTTFFIMNLFISVIVDKFTEEIKKRQGADDFTDEQKEWVKILRQLAYSSPKLKPVKPKGGCRLNFFKIAES